MPLSTRSSAHKANNTSRDNLLSEMNVLEARKVGITAKEKELQDPLDAESRRIRDKFAKKHAKIDERLFELRTKLETKPEEEVEDEIIVLPRKPTAISSRVRPRPIAASEQTMKRKQREVRNVGNTVWERMEFDKSCDKCTRAGVDCYRGVAEKGRLTKWPVFIRGVRYGPCRSCKLERCGCVMEKVAGGSGKVVRFAPSGPSGSGRENQDKRSGEVGARGEDGEVEQALLALLTGGDELRGIIESHCKAHKRLLEALIGEGSSEVDEKMDVVEDSD